MSKTLVTLALMCASLQAQVTGASIAATAESSVVNGAHAVNPVIEWNRTLLVILRTAGAQPPTIHSTRSFAILHASIFDAVNNIDGTYSPYLVRLSNVSRLASQPAAADQAAHDVLVPLYPAFQATLDAELQQDLAQIPNGQNKADGIAVGQAGDAELVEVAVPPAESGLDDTMQLAATEAARHDQAPPDRRLDFGERDTDLQGIGLPEAHAGEYAATGDDVQPGQPS